ncbi:hypothetical protein HMN09_00013900 [Mycena chlorophos]|uniref:Uncharacterized protein n=1 Tax=Mycena chlorophos TaxID=658473 RepID=A0A8H6TT86_MYCCL|nr:hypothetical protein HMN09_00013900 [Mycena chlorophos]
MKLPKTGTTTLNSNQRPRRHEGANVHTLTMATTTSSPATPPTLHDHDNADDFEDQPPPTPHKYRQQQQQQQPRLRDSQSTTENWDEDFAEDEGSAPDGHGHGQQMSSSTDSHSTHSPISSPSETHPTNSQSSFALPPPPSGRPRSRSRERHRDRTPRASKIRPRAGPGPPVPIPAQDHPPPQPQWAESSDDELDADELGFGDEEDRTVTAKTGRRAFSHHLLNASPPPPVPPLPPSATVGRRGVPLHMTIPTKDSFGAMPFPRSPTTSVFSAPDNASIAYTHTSAGSTTHLRPSSRSGKKDKDAAKGLAGLPPSPPIHRERRRLRKKSRPHGNGSGHPPPLEMRPMHGAFRRESSEEGGVAGVTEEEVEDWDADLEREQEAEAEAELQRQQQHHHQHPYGSNANGSTNALGSTSQINNSSKNASTSQVALSVTGGSSLLSRIGSVKRWGVGRRKKSSSVSVASEGPHNSELDVIEDIQSHTLLRSGSQSSSHSRHSYAAPSTSPSPPAASNSRIRHSQYDVPRTPPRPTHATPQSSAGASGASGGGSRWFFRASSGSPSDQPQRERGRLRAKQEKLARAGPESSVGRDGSPGPQGEVGRPYTPSPMGGAGPAEKEDSTAKLVKRRSLGFVQIRKNLRPLNGGAENEATPTQGSTGASAVTPTPAPGRTNPTTTPNSSPSKYGALGVGRPPAESVEDLKDKEGMGFIERNVRRISLVGRHKRTKSGVSLSSVPVTLPTEPPTPPVDVQLQPPSPPQTVRSPSGGSTMTMTPPLDIGSPPRRTHAHIDGLPMAFSPPSSNSTPGSLTLNSPISLASSSTPSLTPYTSAAPSPKSPLAPHGHAASLGRSAMANGHVPNLSAQNTGSTGSGAMRRNSLGDLKIPARISQAQHGLRRDLGMVREFARNVEELKDLQTIFQSLVSEVQGILDAHVLNQPPPPKEESPRVSSSPTFFRRHRSNTSSSNPNAPSPLVQQQQAYKQLASTFYTINSKYRISWECAELLIELGGGSTNASSSTPPTTSSSAPTIAGDGKVKSRERAITLTTDDGRKSPAPPIASPPPSSAWRASTGRNDLSQRQLILLKEMLGSPTPPADESFGPDGIPEESPTSLGVVNREWRWGDAMGSTVTLPSEENAGGGEREKEKGKDKKRRSSRLRMSGIRDMLRALKKSGQASSASISTESSSGDPALVNGLPAPSSSHLYDHGQVPTQGRRRRAKTSAGPESIRSNEPSSFKTASASPRRPSLAAIFRIGKPAKTPPASATSSPEELFGHELYPTFSGISGGRESAQNSTEEEEDWDRLEDSASDIEAAIAAEQQQQQGGPGVAATNTIRGRSPYGVSLLTAGRPNTPMRSPSGSRTSLNQLPPTRSTRLSNVEEQPGDPSTSPSRQLSSRSRRGGGVSGGASKAGSVRSMPPGPDLTKLAMTPENIKPLLENAREVHARLTDCIAELRELLLVNAPPGPDSSNC